MGSFKGSEPLGDFKAHGFGFGVYTLKFLGTRILSPGSTVTRAWGLGFRAATHIQISDVWV